MRFIVYGAGAVGGVVGARLFQHGYDVVLIARGAHGDAIRTHGLRFEWPEGGETLPIPAVEHPSRVTFAAGDVVLLGVKSQDSAEALRTLAAYAPPTTPVASLQNGVANEPLALRFFPNVYGICVLCPAEHLEPGVVRANSWPFVGGLDIGRYPTGADETAGTVAAALASSGFASVARAGIMPWKYGKLLANLGNAIQALLGEHTDEIAQRARDEGVACLAAAGIDFEVHHPYRERMTLRPVGDRARRGGSSWQSLERGTGSVESDYLNGEIALLGRLHGVPTPVNTRLQHLMALRARTHGRPGGLTRAEFEAGLPRPTHPRQPDDHDGMSSDIGASRQ